MVGKTDVSVSVLFPVQSVIELVGHTLDVKRRAFIYLKQRGILCGVFSSYWLLV